MKSPSESVEIHSTRSFFPFEESPKMDKSRITTTTRSTITMGRRNGSIDERRKKRFFSALCSPAPRAAMLAVARGTAPNSLPDWSMWSRDQDAVVGVIGSPLLHTDAVYASSLRCQPLTHSPIIFSNTSSCSYTNWESTLAYTRGWIGVWKHGYGFRKEWETFVRMCARMWTYTTKRRSNFVEEWSWVLRVESRAGTRLQLDRS